MKSIEATWQDVQQGLLTFTQVVNSCLTRIEESEHCNIYIEVYREEALAKAKKLDEKVSNGEALGSMLGGIVALKDNLCYTGHSNRGIRHTQRLCKPLHSNSRSASSR